MSSERQVRLFRSGRNQAVRIPRGFELPGKNAVIRKAGERLVVAPVPSKCLLDVLQTLTPLEEDFPEIADAPPRVVNR